MRGTRTACGEAERPSSSKTCWLGRGIAARRREGDMAHEGHLAGPRPSEDLLEAAHSVLRSERRRLHELGVAGELRLVGGASLPGLLTHGDIDLLLRVSAADFTSVVQRLGETFAARREDLWTPEMALFLIDPAIPVELAVVPEGSAQDAHFVRAWDRLAASAALRERYNRLKTTGGSDYNGRKAAFFEEIASDGPSHRRETARHTSRGDAIDPA
ncbi:GrpB family protein [Microbacterium ureisolvens]|uniref:GrpB family protein n=1 Tax=Microbacterium ureisolvens TaxID=2781186 RepID=UPI00363C4491